MTFPRSRDFAVRCPCAEEQVQTVTATVETRRLGFAQETLKRTRLFFFIKLRMVNLAIRRCQQLDAEDCFLFSIKCPINWEL